MRWRQLPDGSRAMLATLALSALLMRGDVSLYVDMAVHNFFDSPSPSAKQSASSPSIVDHACALGVAVMSSLGSLTFADTRFQPLQYRSRTTWFQR